MEAGIFTANGEEYTDSLTFHEPKDFFESGEPADEEDQSIDADLDGKKIDEKKVGKKYYCEHCKLDLYFPSNVEILKHKKSHV